MRAGLFAGGSLVALAVATGALLTFEPGGEATETPDPRMNERLVQTAHTTLLAWEARHERRFSEALDPDTSEDAFQARLQAAADAGAVDGLEREGFELFVRDRSLKRRRKPASEANRCASCHHRLGPGGSGGLVDNFFGGRNPPSLAGSGLLERLAAEMSADLAADARAGRPLHTQGVSFGTAEAPQGIARDLRIRPFGRGRWSSIEEAVVVMGTEALGIELNDSERLALRTWIAALPPPGLEPPDASRMPDLFERYQLGRVRFGTLGCATCHVPEMKLADGTSVRAYTDLKSHDLGEALAYRGERRHLTAPLWGVAGTAPWLHDGRALADLEDAILAHGGEAEASRKAFETLDSVRRGEVKTFLLSLTPMPKLQVAGQ